MARPSCRQASPYASGATTVERRCVCRGLDNGRTVPATGSPEPEAGLQASSSGASDAFARAFSAAMIVEAGKPCRMSCWRSLRKWAASRMRADGPRSRRAIARSSSACSSRAPKTSLTASSASVCRDAEVLQAPKHVAAAARAHLGLGAGRRQGDAAVVERARVLQPPDRGVDRLGRVVFPPQPLAHLRLGELASRQHREAGRVRRPDGVAHERASSMKNAQCRMHNATDARASAARHGRLAPTQPKAGSREPTSRTAARPRRARWSSRRVPSPGARRPTSSRFPAPGA